MEIYVIHKKSQFNKRQQERLSNLAKTFYIEEAKNIGAIYKSNSPKIVAIDPSIAGYKIDATFLSKINNLKAICLFTTTTHYVDMNYCKKNNIMVTNNINYAGEAIAEYLVFLAMCCCKKLPLQIKFGKQEFSSIFTQTQLKGKIAGIIGLGNIGIILADICTRMGMKVFYWSKDNRDPRYRYVELDQLFLYSDIVFNVLAINKDTVKLIKDDYLNSMKKSAIFISGTSTHLHNHELLLDNVKRGRLFGYGLEEKDKTVMDYAGNVMVTSEYAWFTKEAMSARCDIWIDGIEIALKRNV